MKHCEYCGERLLQRRDEDRWSFNKRKTCGRECFSRMQEHRAEMRSEACGVLREPPDEYKAEIERRIAEVRPSFVGADLQ